MNRPPDPRLLALIKGSLFLICLLPFVRLLWLSQHSFGMAEDPVELVQQSTGSWTLNFLLLTLCISPLRAITQQHWLLRLRRMFGLFTFFYASLHLLAFIGFEHEFAVDQISRGIFKHPFVSVGFAAFLLLIPLAATSNQWAIRALGGRKWQELHRNIYLVGILACVHYLWLSKLSEMIWPLLYTGALAALLGWRIRERRRKAIPAVAKDVAKPLRFFKQRPE